MVSSFVSLLFVVSFSQIIIKRIVLFCVKTSVLHIFKKKEEETMKKTFYVVLNFLFWFILYFDFIFVEFEVALYFTLKPSKLQVDYFFPEVYILYKMFSNPKIKLRVGVQISTRLLTIATLFVLVAFYSNVADASCCGCCCPGCCCCSPCQCCNPPLLIKLPRTSPCCCCCKPCCCCG